MRALQGCKAASSGYAYGLVDYHEVAGQQAQTGQALCLGLQLLFDACGHLELLRHEHIDHSGRVRCAHQGGVLQLTCRPIGPRALRRRPARPAPGCPG